MALWKHSGVNIFWQIHQLQALLVAAWELQLCFQTHLCILTLTNCDKASQRDWNCCLRLRRLPGQTSSRDTQPRHHLSRAGVTFQTENRTVCIILPISHQSSSMDTVYIRIKHEKRKIKRQWHNSSEQTEIQHETPCWSSPCSSTTNNTKKCILCNYLTIRGQTVWLNSVVFFSPSNLTSNLKST